MDLEMLMIYAFDSTGRKIPRAVQWEHMHISKKKWVYVEGAIDMSGPNRTHDKPAEKAPIGSRSLGATA